MRWTSSFPAIKIKPNPIFLLSILHSCIFSQVSCLRLLCFLSLGVSLIGDVEWGSSRPCVQVWANYRDSHQGWVTFWLHAQGIQSRWGSTWVKPVTLTSRCNQHTWEIQQAHCSLDIQYQKHRFCCNMSNIMFSLFHRFIVNVQIQADAESNKKNHDDWTARWGI